MIATAQLLAAGAVEARVLGLDQPAMSITGSGAHGILATLPLYAAQQVWGLSEECLWRATALSYLVCMYIKEYSGRLSAFCGCAIAAGTRRGLRPGPDAGRRPDALARTIRNMASSITGMICDGGNQGCVMKGVTAVDAAFRAATFACSGVAIDRSRHQRPGPGDHHALHGTHRLPWHGGDGKDHRGDLRGKNGITCAPCSPHPAQKNCQP